jgi:serine O-acetyltransferase
MPCLRALDTGFVQFVQKVAVVCGDVFVPIHDTGAVLKDIVLTPGHIHIATAVGRGDFGCAGERMRDPDWQADLLRYPPRPLLKEQSAWALWVYRFGRRSDRRQVRLVRWMGDRLYWLLFRLTETLTGISIPKGVKIGPGLRIYHFGNIFVDKGVKIGPGCTLRQGVTIGLRHEDGPAPVLEDDVDVGAYAQILGGVRIGRGARIGAMSVVLNDVPPGATAVGIPARVISRDAETRRRGDAERANSEAQPATQN